MKKALRIILLGVVSLCMGTTVQAQWTDVTERLLVNPGFESGYTGWEYYTQNRCSTNISYDALEFYSGTFGVYQTIPEAPIGRYRVSCQAYYRAGANDEAYAAHLNGTEEITAMLYAGGEETPVPSVFDYSRNYESESDYVKGNGRNRVYYPNTMKGGRTSFDEGQYWVSVEVAHWGGELAIGVYNAIKKDYNWCFMDNFKVEYYGELPVIELESISFDRAELHLIKGYDHAMKVEFYPANATGTVTWTTSNSRVAVVDSDGWVTAMGKGECIVTATCEGLTADVVVYVEDATGMGWVDITEGNLQNPDMEVPYEGWECYRSGGNYNYTYGSAELWNNTFDFFQYTPDLPEGFYRVTCQGYSSTTDPACLYMGEEGFGERVAMRDINNYDIHELAAEGSSGLFAYFYNPEIGDYTLCYKPNNFEAASWYCRNGYYEGNTVVAYHPGGPLRLGLVAENFVSERWVVFDHFTLERLMTVVATKSLAITGDFSPLIAGETRQLGCTVTPADATFQSVLWSSSDEKVLTVDKNGLVTAIANGTATIIATAFDNSKISARKTFTVGDNGATGRELVINEVMSMNADQFVDPSWNYGGWIELYNSTADPVSLVGFYVTDDPEDLQKHQLRSAGVVPAKGFYTIWFDHFSEKYKDHIQQVDFKLDTDGGWIALVSPDGEVLAEQTYPAGMQRTSWARTVNGGSDWGFTSQPTPGESNNDSPFATERLAAPTVDVEGHLFTEYPVVIKAQWPEGATLRYTTDGSAPTATNGETSLDGEFIITDSRYTTLRLCAVQDGYLTSPVTTNTYIYKVAGLTIPVMAISGTDNDFFSNQMGMFVDGTNGVPGGPGNKSNVFRDWERPGVFEYFEPETGERLFCQEVGLSPAGGWSRQYGVHTSFKIKATKQYGLNSMDYPFFEHKPFNKHKVLQIRNGGNDNSRFKDAALQSIIGRSGFYIDYQEYQPVFHYINGRYACVFNMREPNNKHHAYSNYGLDTDLMDQFELTSHPTNGPDGQKNYYDQMAGTRDTFDLWCKLAEQCEDPQVYKRICDELVDIDEFINYFAAEFWMSPNDWLSNTNNVKGFRSNEGDGKFHFVMFDLDSAFDGGNQMTAIDGQNGNAHVVQKLWKNMMRNEQCRKQFVDAFCLVGGSIFEPSRCEQIINELADVAQPMMDLSGDGWRVRDTRNDLLGKLAGNGSRRTTSINNLRNYSRVSDMTKDGIDLTFSANHSEARLLFNGMNVPTDRFTGRLFLPVTLTASEVPGYEFEGWQMRGSTSQNSTTVFGNGSQWRFYNQPGGLDGEDWTTAAYSAQWEQGMAPVGYDTGNRNGHPLNSRYSNEQQPTYYLAKTFTLDSKGDDDIFTLSYKVDDGMVVYVNGEEAARFNMPAGTVTYATYTPTYKFEEGTLTLPTALFRQGENTIAVELHNYNATSTDIYWDAALLQQSVEEVEGELVSADPELVLDRTFHGAGLIAVYRPVAALADVPVKVNEVSAGNDIYVNDYYKKDDWIELYNTTDEPIDVAGMWLTDNASKPQKFQIPDNDEQQTVIEPHGRLVIWASKRNNKGEQIHANFKLANGDGEMVMLTAEEGDWHTWLTYNAHSAKETVGLFPDGGERVYRLTRPTIGKPNALTSYAEFLYFNDADPAVPKPETFTLNLNEGWNWVSHPLEREVAVSELNAHALQFVGQTASAQKEGDLWTGTLTSLAPATAYKVLMAADDAVALEAPFYDASRGISLRLGWNNWIGYPCTASQSLDEAFARFTPHEGDGILGRQGFAIYENGKWEGTLTSLDPGQGYLYGAQDANTLLLAESAPASVSEQVRKAPRFHAQPRSPWTAVDAPYPDVMGMVCELQQDGVPCEPGAFTLAAFAEDGECRGVGRYIDGLIYLSVFGTGGERFALQASEAATGVVYEVAGSPFITNAVLGSRKEPLPVGIGSPVGIASLKQASGAQSLGYYRLDGTYAGREQSSLPRGIYVKKCRLADGTVISNKITISISTSR